MEIECTGHVLPKGMIFIDPSILGNIKTGAVLKLKICVPDERTEAMPEGELSPSVKRFFNLIESLKPIGAPSDPEELGHARLLEEKIEERLPCSG